MSSFKASRSNTQTLTITKELVVDSTTLVVDDDGNKVGVGTASPQTDLDVRSATGGTLTLSTSDTTVEENDVLGQINFQAPLEAGGTDAILVAASIKAVALDDFASDFNAVELVFSTGESEAATEKMRIGARGTITTQLNLGTDATVFTDAFANDTDAEGEVIKFLNIGSLSAGLIYYLNPTGPTWTAANANSTPVGEEHMLAIAVGANSTDNGMMIRGMVRLASDAYEGAAGVGKPVYMADVAGKMDFAAPASSGDIVRIVGYCLKVGAGGGDDANDILVYFNPSNDYVEIA